MVKQDRSLGLLILFSILTCGIYSYFFWYKLAEDMNIMCDGDGEHTTDGIVMILLFLFTFGIYPYIWYYQVGNRLQSNAKRYGLEFNESGTTVVLWLILGIFVAIGPFIGLYIIIKNANTVAVMYNNSRGGSAKQGFNAYNNAHGNSYDNMQNNGMAGNSGYHYLSDANQSPVTEEPVKTLAIDYNQGKKTISLACRSGEFSGASFEIGVNEKVTIGRDYSCNIKFASTTPNVSRNHCTVWYDGQNIWLADNGSSYGTYLMDGTRLEPMKPVSINEGTGFYLGSSNVLFYVSR
ncbi:MAG: DUF4234 domain-containing protein [Clostridia bacterium]|nr:DUF4234 domain-containing protein [Clostridia bacterium]